MDSSQAPEDSRPAGSGIGRSGNTDALPVAPALGLSLDKAHMPRKPTLVSHRTVGISILAIILGVVSSYIAQFLMFFINIITDLAFYGTVSDVIGPNAPDGYFVLSAAGTQIGAWVIVMPVIGGLLAGFMARWGSRAIQGHGIPEAMESILTNDSNIAARITWLKPVSAAFTIGTGGPFGAEGPIISTGGALGSVIGQLLRTTAQERKTLLAAGAAAGMAAVFGAPVASVAMAVELLLFELRPRSLVPVALASAAAVGIRYLTYGPAAVFVMPDVLQPGMGALVIYTLVGGIVGVASIGVTHAVYWVEDMFAKLPHVHWMWWPAIGAAIAGFIGWIEPRTLGVGYDNIDALLQGQFAVSMVLTFGILKFLAWVIALGSNTSGGTLAPLFMIGGSLAAFCSYIIAGWLPTWGIDPRIAALVGMGAIFAGSARALFTSVIFCFETTRQPAVLLPLLSGCTLAYLVSALLMRNTIMTEKTSRRGVNVPDEYAADYLRQVTVGRACSHYVVTFKDSDDLGTVRDWLSSGVKGTRHGGFPVVDDNNRIRGVVTRRFLFQPDLPRDRKLGDIIDRDPLTIYEDYSLRAAVNHMVANGVGRLIVVGSDDPGRVVGIITRGDILRGYAGNLKASTHAKRHIRMHHAFNNHQRG